MSATICLNSIWMELICRCEDDNDTHTDTNKISIFRRWMEIIIRISENEISEISSDWIVRAVYLKSRN